MSLRIACDLDGTVADMTGALLREAEQLFGPGVSLSQGAMSLPPRLGSVSETSSDPRDPSLPTVPPPRVLSTREMQKLWAHVRRIEDFWLTLRVIEEGALERFCRLSTTHRWHVVFMTRRPQTRGDSTQRQSQRWLQQNGFEFPAVCVVAHSRGQVVGALEFNAVIDDRPETCLDVVADARAEPILVWRAGMDTIPPGVAALGVTAVASFHAALDRLEELATAARGPGLVERLKAAIRRT